MKKSKLILITVCLFFGISSVYALSQNFNFDTSKLSFSKKNSVVDNFDKKYTLSKKINNIDEKKENEIKDLTKKTTYLLLGNQGNEEESSADYYKRHKDYTDMASYNYFPKDEDSSSGYDESNPLYRYVLASELAIPQLFNSFNELDIVYNSYGDIRVTLNDDLVISTIVLPDVKMKEEDSNNTMNYKTVKTNLIIYYYYIKIDGKYRLTYLYGETTDNVNKYFNELEDNEEKSSMSMASYYESNLANVYNFDKLDALTDNEISNVYKNNNTNVFYLRSYYNNKVISSANATLINDGILLTTYSFIENALINSQYITVKDNSGKSYNLDGFITANPESDIVILKLKEQPKSSLKIYKNNKINIEDPIINLSSKSGVGLTVQKGIVISNNNYIQTSIPLSKTDEGSPLFNKDGLLVGVSTSKSINSSISYALSPNLIKEAQDKFNKEKFNEIKTITFDKLKEEYYYIKYNKENKVNNIPKSKWNKFKKIGNIENTIKLELTKSSYKDNIVSLRYKNNIAKYVSSMQLSVTFKEQLIKEGYKQTINNTNKSVYENKEYKVIIMDEFDYLIVVMVKL